MSQDSEYRDLGGGRLDIDPRPELLVRALAHEETAAAIENLHAKLATATVIFEKHGDAGREGAWRALTDVVEFLRAQGLPVHSLLPLTALATAISDLDRRVMSPLLAPRVGRGAPPKSTGEASTDALLAVVTECFVRKLRAEGVADYAKRAAGDAARIVNSSPIALRVDQVRMREVRETISALRGNDPRRALFDDLVREATHAVSIDQWLKDFVGSGWVPTAHISGQIPVFPGKAHSQRLATNDGG